MVNTLSAGDKVLSASAGAFGDRFADVAEAYKADVQRLNVEWGDPIDPETVREALREDPDIRAVLITHNETSTGVTHDLESLSGVVKGEFGKLLLVDAVSSLGCVPLPVDGWDCDMVGTASQKGFMIPPGLAFISVSDAAWQAQQEADMPPVLLRPGGGQELPGTGPDSLDAKPFGNVRPAPGAGEDDG